MRAMSPAARKLSALLVLAASFGLGGCENQALLQWFDNKPKLQGNRVPVFPEGVPGVQQGVPPELMKGYQAQTDQQVQTQAAAEEAQKTAEEERKRAQAERRAAAPPPQRVSQPRPQRPPAQPRAVQPAPEPAAAEAPPPQPQRSTSAPLADRWPSADPPPQQRPQQQQQQQQPQQSATTRAWPGSEPAGPPTDRFR